MISAARKLVAAGRVNPMRSRHLLVLVLALAGIGSACTGQGNGVQEVSGAVDAWEASPDLTGPADPGQVAPDEASQDYPENPDGLGVDVTPELTFVSLEPAHGPTTGMTTTTLKGTGFQEGLQILFGDTLALFPFVLSDGIVNCTAPPHASGTVDVRILLPDGREAVMEDAFTYQGALRLDSVEPAQGSPQGGTPVRIRGAGFLQGPTFLFGGRAAVGVEVMDDETALVVTPPGEPGVVSLIAVAGSAHAVLPLAFEYGPTVVMPGLPGFSVTSCQPDSGPVKGGTTIYISGTGFSSGSWVRVGALPATEVQVLGETLIRVVTPEGSPGPADVVVRRSSVEASLEDGFHFQTGEPVVLAVEPEIGSWAGGTRIRIYGHGLEGTEHLFFGTQEAQELTVESSILLTARAPRAADVGYVPVTVFGGGASLANAAYFYFDPSLKGGGTWGGPIDGAVNVTVMSYGKPLPQAYVMLGHDAHTPWQGRTDDRGQITFSDFGLAGRTTVTATKEACTVYSVADFDASNVTVYISPASTPESTGLPPGYGAKNCTVRGRVLDYDKYFLKPSWVEGDVHVRCGTSSSSLYGGTPDPGPGAVVDDHGRFEIITRTGQFSVICQLMFHDPDLYKDVPLRMGAAVHVKCPQPAVVEGVDVTLGIETDAELWVALDNVPGALDDVNGPNFMGGFKLGSDGYLDILRNLDRESTDRVRFLYQPRLFTGPIEGYGYSFYTTVSSKSGSGMPYGVTLATDRPAPESWPVLVEGDAGFAEVPTKLRRAVTAMLEVDDGIVLAADTGGGTYWFNGQDFYLAPVHTHRAIYDLWGSDLDDFWAVGAGGSVWRVQGNEAHEVPTGITEALTGISGESGENLHVAGGSFLLWWDGLSFHPENVPAGVKLTKVRRFPGGDMVAIGREGAVLKGVVGDSLPLSKPVAVDLNGMDGPSMGDLWIAGAGGTLLHLTEDGFNCYTAPTEEDLRGVVYRGPCDVLVYGDRGTVFRFDCQAFQDLSRTDADLDLLAGALREGVPVLAGRHYVVLPPFIGFADITSPVASHTWPGDALAFDFSGEPAISHHQAILSGSDGKPFWIVMANGEAREVLLPDIETITGYNPIPPGYKRMNLTSVFSPDFHIDGYSSANLNFYRRQAFSVNLVSFD